MNKFLIRNTSNTDSLSDDDMETFLRGKKIFFSANKVGIGKIPTSDTFEVLGNITCTGSFIASVNANLQKIINVANGTNNNDAVNKSQLDTKANLNGATFTGDVTIPNLTVNGTTTFINTTNLEVQDSLCKIARSNTSSDTLDIGQYGVYNSGGVKYCGVFRDASDSGKWKFFHGLQEEPTTTVNTSGTGFTLSDIQCNTLNANSTNISGNINIGNNILTAGQINCGDLRSSGNFTFWLTNGGALNVTRQIISASNTLFAGDVIFKDESQVNTFLYISQTLNGIYFSIPTSLFSTGIGNSAVNSVSLANDGIIPNITKFMGIINITSSPNHRCVLGFTISGTLLDNQIIILRNSTGVHLHIAQMALASSGSNASIRCNPNTFLGVGQCLKLVWNSTASRFEAVDQNANECLRKLTPVRWTNDVSLSSKVHTNNSREFLFAVNFTASSNQTVNGVTFTSTQSGSYSGTGLTISSGAGFGYITFSGFDITDTQSNKLKNYFYGSTHWNFQITGMTIGSFYEFLLFRMVYDAGFPRTTALYDYDNATYPTPLGLNTQWECVNGTPSSGNNTGQILSYIFQAGNTTKTLRLVNVSASDGAHIYAVACIHHGTGFSTGITI